MGGGEPFLLNPPSLVSNREVKFKTRESPYYSGFILNFIKVKRRKIQEDFFFGKEVELSLFGKEGMRNYVKRTETGPVREVQYSVINKPPKMVDSTRKKDRRKKVGK